MFATDFADIDNDGDLDVGSISFGADDGLHVYLNLGNGAWRRSFGFSGGNSTMHFYFRDVNRDGNADIIAGHGTGTVWLGDGTGQFTPANTGLPSSSYGLAGLSAGDVDNDGGCDLALVNSTGGVEVYIWNEQALTWQSFSGNLPAVDSFYATQLCDMNADGAVDLVALRRGYIQIWAGDGQGNWTSLAQIQMSRPNGYSAMRAGADFDHNGYPDLAVVTREGSWPNDHNVAHAYREASPVDSLKVFPVFPRGGERFEPGAVQFVDWWSEAPGFDSTRVRLELSVSGSGGPWEVIADSLRNAGRYQWSVPQGVVSGDCYIRYTVYSHSGTVQAVTPRAFGIGAPVGATEAGTMPNVRGRVSFVAGALLIESGSGPEEHALLDATGRQVATLRAGANNVSSLAIGVYFIRPVRGKGREMSRMQRVVIAR